MQGGPLMHVIAAKAVAFGEALKPEFRTYAQGGGRQRAGAGRDAQGPRLRHRLRRHRHASDAGRSAAEEAHRQGRRAEPRARRTSPATRTAIPFDPEKPTITSGVRLGSPAATTRGFGIDGVPPGRPADRRRARWACRQQFGRQHGASRPRCARKWENCAGASRSIRESEAGQGEEACAVRSAAMTTRR